MANNEGEDFKKGLNLISKAAAGRVKKLNLNLVFVLIVCFLGGLFVYEMVKELDKPFKNWFIMFLCFFVIVIIVFIIIYAYNDNKLQNISEKDPSK